MRTDPQPRQRHARRRYPRHGRCRGVRACDHGPVARPHLWLALDGPAGGHYRRVVIASWAYGLIRDTGAILLDMNPDRSMAERVRAMVEADGDQLTIYTCGVSGRGTWARSFQLRQGGRMNQSVLSRSSVRFARSPT